MNTVVVGPLPIFFGNVNKAMQLPGHHHTGAVTLHYGYEDGEHGYPSFAVTNDLTRSRLQLLTRRIFRDSTNEDVARRLWQAFAGWCPDEWAQWGGSYWLQRLDLDVEGVRDDIGHDDSTTRYTRQLDAGEERIMLPAGRTQSSPEWVGVKVS
jgi:hypothetical protein